MSVVEFRVRWSGKEIDLLTTMASMAERVGNCTSLALDQDDALVMASLLTHTGGTWMCIVKTLSGVQVFRHESPTPSWEGPSLSDFVSEIRVHTATFNTLEKIEA